MRSAAGNMQVAVAAAGFTTLIFIIIALVAALALGLGRRSDRSRRSSSRREAPSRSRGQERSRPARAERPRAGLARGGFQPGGKFGISKHPDKMKVEVNPNKCARFGFCEHEAPDVFYLESDGRFGYQASVPVEQMEEVIRAMDVCPRRAIKVKLPPEAAQARVAPEEPLTEDPRRTIIPIFSEHSPENGGRRR